MNTTRSTLLSLAATTLLSATAAHSEAGEWMDMLAGNLEQWAPSGDANWSFDGEVVGANSGRGFLVSQASFGDFELKLEFYPATDSNSGVFMRCADGQSINDKTCYEANIFDKRPDQSGRTGGIPNFAPPSAVIDTEGQWNTYEIMAKGSHLTIKLNGQQTVDVQDSTLKSGPIALQYAAGSIQFRNVQLRTLD